MRRASLSFALLAAILLLTMLCGCARPFRADVIAVSTPDYHESGQSFRIVPGPGMTGIPEATFMQASNSLAAVLHAKGYRTAPAQDDADLLIQLSWTVSGPFQHRLPATYEPRPMFSPFGLARPMSRAYGWNSFRDRYDGYYPGYAAPATTIINIYRHTLTIAALAKSTNAPADTGKPIAQYGSKTGPASPSPELPEYARPPYAPLLPEAETTGKSRTPHTTRLAQGSQTTPEDETVVWKVIVDHDSTASSIQPILPKLIMAASRWLGQSTNIKVIVDDEFNVIPAPNNAP